MRFFGVGGSIVSGVVGTSLGPVGFDVGPIQCPTQGTCILLMLV